MQIETNPTRKLAHIRFTGARAEPLGELGAGAAPLAKTLDQSAALLANEQVGAAQKLLEMTVDYAKAFGVKKTFGLIAGRVTFVIDREGVVRHRFDSLIRVNEHVSQALALVKQLEAKSAA